MGVFTIVMLALLALLLVAAGVEDIRHREIANHKNIAIAVLAPLWWWAAGYHAWPDVPIQILVGLLTFSLFCIPFFFGWMGGGDVKLIGALALWLPAVPLIVMLMWMSILGGALTLVTLAWHRWRHVEGPVETPYGVAIVAASLIQFSQPILNHFAHS